MIVGVKMICNKIVLDACLLTLIEKSPVLKKWMSTGI